VAGPQPADALSGAQAEPAYPELVSMDVIDNVPPVITCPAAVTVECIADVPPQDLRRERERQLRSDPDGRVG